MPGHIRESRHTNTVDGSSCIHIVHCCAMQRAGHTLVGPEITAGGTPLTAQLGTVHTHNVKIIQDDTHEQSH